eukprot:527538_1
MIVCWISLMGIYVYLTFPEPFYDPFSGQFGYNKTVINWKDIFLGAYSLLVLFIGKTIFVFIESQIFHKQQLKKANLRKSVSLVIRPLIKWMNKSDMENNNISSEDNALINVVGMDNDQDQNGKVNFWI